MATWLKMGAGVQVERTVVSQEPVAPVDRKCEPGVSSWGRWAQVIIMTAWCHDARLRTTGPWSRPRVWDGQPEWGGHQPHLASKDTLRFRLKMLAAQQGHVKHRETSIFHRNLRENDLCLNWIKCYWNLSHRKDSLKISAVYVRVCVTAQDRALNKVLPVGRTLDTLTMFLWTFFSLKAALEQDFLGDGHL